MVYGLAAATRLLLSPVADCSTPGLCEPGVDPCRYRERLKFAPPPNPAPIW